MKKYSLSSRIISRRTDVFISEDDFQQAKKAFDVVNEAVLFEERFDAVVGGFLDFEKGMISHLMDFTYVGISEKTDVLASRRHLNRLMMNALSAVRGYVDHMGHACNIIFDGDQSRYLECKNLLSKCYDESLGFRMFEALRNHAQHQGFPIQVVSYCLEKDDGGGKIYGRKSIAPLVNVGVLAKNDKFKEKTLAEMQEIGDSIDLKTYFREYIESIAQAHYFLRDVSLSCIKDSDAILRALANRYIDRHNLASDYCVEAISIEDGVICESIPLYTGDYEYYKFLAKNNGGLSNMKKIYIATLGKRN